MTWIRFEPLPRYHAVYVDTGLRLVTYCGRRAEPHELRAEASEDPPARCRGCRTRIERPYLIPEALLELREAAKARTAGGAA